jgi:hypothetical protein
MRRNRTNNTKSLMKNKQKLDVSDLLIESRLVLTDRLLTRSAFFGTYSGTRSQVAFHECIALP